MRRSATVQGGSQSNPTAALLDWCKQTCDSYSGVSIKNFTTSWADGLAFCALAHSACPEKVDFGSLDKQNALNNMNLAFDVFKSLGVERLLDAEDIVEHQEQKSIITYLLMVYKKLRPAQNLLSLGPTPKARPKSALAPPRYNTTPTKLLLSENSSESESTSSLDASQKPISQLKTKPDDKLSEKETASNSETQRTARPVKPLSQIRASEQLRVLQRTSSLPNIPKKIPDLNAPKGAEKKGEAKVDSPKPEKRPKTDESVDGKKEAKEDDKTGAAKPNSPRRRTKDASLKGDKHSQTETPLASTPRKPSKKPSSSDVLSVPTEPKSKTTEDTPIQPDSTSLESPSSMVSHLDLSASPLSSSSSSSLSSPVSNFVEEKQQKRDRSAILGNWSNTPNLKTNEPVFTETSDTNKYDALYKIIVIGDSATGKTSLLSRWLNDTFDPTNASTVGTELATKTYACNDQLIKIQLWDTAGQERYRAVTRQYYRGAVGAVIVYDISRRESFENVQNWLEDLKEYNPDVVNMQILLIGNKSDLDPLREVPISEGLSFAKKEGLSFMETSAKEGENALKAFQIVMQDVYKAQQARPNKLEGSASTSSPTSNRKVIELGPSEEAPTNTNQSSFSSCSC